MTEPTRWAASRTISAQQYAAHFDALAAAGRDVHGEASFVAGLCPAGGRILDAGCGTGRVSIRLAQLGFDCCGVDADEDMLAQAYAGEPRLVCWAAGDICDRASWVRLPRDANAAPAPLPDWLNAGADLIVMAGNVIALLAPATLPRCLAVAAAVVRPGGALVTGFGLDRAHLPRGCPPTPLADHDAAALSAGFAIAQRYGGWSGEPFARGYAVSVLRRSSRP